VLIKVIPVQDNVEEKTETVVLTLNESPLYRLGDEISAVVTIRDK